MMINLQHSKLARLLLVVGAMLALESAIQFSSAATYAQQPSMSETPDPYFSSNTKPQSSFAGQSRSNNFQPLAKPIRMPAQPATAVESTPALWMPPVLKTKPVVNPSAANPFPVKQKPLVSTIAWEAPVTNATVPSIPKPALNNQPLNNQPFKPQPHDSQAWNNQSFGIHSPAAQPNTQPRLADNSSIIRERSSNSSGNDFSSNDFSPNVTSERSFELVPQKPVSRPAPTKPQAKPSNQLSARPPAPTQMIQQHPKPKLQENIVSREVAKSFEPGKVLALVGGEPIFVGDLMFEINQVIEKFIAGAPENIKQKRRQEMIPQVLPKFVEAKILYLGAMRELPDDANIENVLQQAEKEFDENQLEKMLKASGLNSSTEFDAYLRGQGSSLRKFKRKWSQEQMTRFFLSRQLNINSEVTHQEMLDTYRENIDSYALDAKCRWEQVMIRFDRSTSHAVAKEKIVELGNQIVYGANLNAVAKKHSHGYMASEGGKHDWTTKGALVLEEVDEALFSLPVGQLSDIIESRDGYHVIRVLERNEATRTPFLEAQVEIKKKILEENRKKAFEAHAEQLKREIPVEYYLNDEI